MSVDINITLVTHRSNLFLTQVSKILLIYNKINIYLYGFEYAQWKVLVRDPYILTCKINIFLKTNFCLYSFVSLGSITCLLSLIEKLFIEICYPYLNFEIFCFLK